MDGWIAALIKTSPNPPFLDAIQNYLYNIQQILVVLHLEMNARPAPFIDHAGIQGWGGLLMGMGMLIRAGKRMMMFICVSASILIIIINLDMMLV